MSSTTLKKKEKKIVTLAALGGMLEFYDFIIYGIFSVYFSHQFFPSHDKFIIVIQSYLIFVLGYVARPIGGIIFSHIGDEYGRKKVLIMTIVLMGMASLGIGFLPTYNQIGMAAPLLLMLLRLVQGLALGGELPSTYVYIRESIPDKLGIVFALVMTGVNSGLLLGMLCNYGLNYSLSSEQLMSFGWRLPFIFGGLTCLVSYQIRKKLHETAVFKKAHDKPKFPLFYLLRHHLKDFLAATAMVSVMSSLVVVSIIFMPTYLHEILNFDSSKVSYLMTIYMLVNVTTIYFSGRIAQRYGAFGTLKRLLILCVFFIPTAYYCIYSEQLIIGLILLSCAQGLSAMVTPYVVTSIFPTMISLTGVALSYNVGFTLFGGLAPLFITNSIRLGANVYLTPVIYLLAMVGICTLGMVAYCYQGFRTKRQGELKVELTSS